MCGAVLFLPQRLLLLLLLLPPSAYPRPAGCRRSSSRCPVDLLLLPYSVPELLLPAAASVPPTVRDTLYLHAGPGAAADLGRSFHLLHLQLLSSLSGTSQRTVRDDGGSFRALFAPARIAAERKRKSTPELKPAHLSQLFFLFFFFFLFFPFVCVSCPGQPCRMSPALRLLLHTLRD